MPVNPRKRSWIRSSRKKQDLGPKTRADSQNHTATLSIVEHLPITGHKSPGNALHFANYSSPKMLMDGVQDAIGLTLLKDMTALTCPCEKRNPGYPATINATIELARAYTFAPTCVVTNAEVLFRWNLVLLDAVGHFLKLHYVEACKKGEGGDSISILDFGRVSGYLDICCVYNLELQLEWYITVQYRSVYKLKILLDFSWHKPKSPAYNTKTMNKILFRTGGIFYNNS